MFRRQIDSCPPWPSGGSRVPAWPGWILILLFSNSLAWSQVVVSVTDTDGWNPWVKADGSLMADTVADQQTGQGSSDFVGDQTTPGFLQKAGQLGGEDSILFRMRMEAFRNQGFNNDILLGMDLNGDGSIDLFMRMDGGTSIDFALPGNDLNISPSTTSVGTWQGPVSLTTSTYDYSSIPEVFGTSGSDAYISFALSFANLQNAVRTYAVGFTDFVMNYDTRIAFIADTSTQGNSLNQDLYGTTGNLSSNLTWGDLGASTAFVTPDGVIPEPAGFLQVTVLLGGVFWVCYGRRPPRVRAQQ